LSNFNSCHSSLQIISFYILIQKVDFLKLSLDRIPQKAKNEVPKSKTAKIIFTIGIWFFVGMVTFKFYHLSTLKAAASTIIHRKNNFSQPEMRSKERIT